MVFSCSPLMTMGAEHFFMYLFTICVSFFLVTFLSNLLPVSIGLPVLPGCKFFILSGHGFFVRCTYYIYFLRVFGLPFHFLIVFKKEKVLIFDEVKFINFLCFILVVS